MRFFLFWQIFWGLGKCCSVVDRFDGVFTTYMMNELFLVSIVWIITMI